MNANSRRLLELCSTQLGVTNLLYSGAFIHHATWMHPKSSQCHQLDLVLTRRQSLNLIQHTRTYHGADCNTDHGGRYQDQSLYETGVTNLYAIAGHFVSYRWVIGPHNFLVILWNLLVQDCWSRLNAKVQHCWSRLNAKVQDCWSRLNASRAARNSFAGRMFVTPGLKRVHYSGLNQPRVVHQHHNACINTTRHTTHVWAKRSRF